MRRDWYNYVSAVCSISSVLLIWELTGRLGFFDMTLVPVPSQVAVGLAAMAWNGMLWMDTVATLRRVLGGFALGTALGLLFGIATGVSARLRPVFEPLIQALRPVPAVALIPVAIAWFGIGDLEKILVVTWAAFFPVWVNTHAGVNGVPKEIVWTAQVLGAGASRIVREVVLPSATPFLVAGARVSLGLSFAATVVAEISGASVGLGYRSFIYHSGNQRGRMLAAVVMIGVVGAGIDFLYNRFTRWRFRWLAQQSTQL